MGTSGNAGPPGPIGPPGEIIPPGIVALSSGNTLSNILTPEADVPLLGQLTSQYVGLGFGSSFVSQEFIIPNSNISLSEFNTAFHLGFADLSFTQLIVTLNNPTVIANDSSFDNASFTVRLYQALAGLETFTPTDLQVTFSLNQGANSNMNLISLGMVNIDPFIRYAVVGYWSDIEGQTPFVTSITFENTSISTTLVYQQFL
jgi:hypothetical protein